MIKLYDVQSDHGRLRGVDEANNDWAEISAACLCGSKAYRSCVSPYWACHRCGGETFEKWLFLCIQTSEEVCGKHIYIDDDGPVAG
jgi:hypothetical protein